MSTFNKSTSNSSEEDDVELRRGPWTVEEDSILIHYIASHGEGRWNLLAEHSGELRKIIIKYNRYFCSIYHHNCTM